MTPIILRRAYLILGKFVWELNFHEIFCRPLDIFAVRFYNGQQVMQSKGNEKEE